MKKAPFYLIWLAIVLVGPVTVLLNAPFAVVIKDQLALINFFQRLIGLLAFSLVFVQIVLGSNMARLTQKFGAWIYKFHITEGAFTYLFILAHPFLSVILNYKIKGVFDPFYVYTDICFICKPRIEYFYTFGRIAFWFITIAVLAAKVRTHPWLRVHWRKFHILNYFAFFLIAIHAWSVGSDVRSVPFVWFFWFAVSAVSAISAYKILGPLFAKLKKVIWAT